MNIDVPNPINTRTVKNITDYHFLIDGPAGNIEALLTTTNSDNTNDSIGVVCHPHPLHGGSMTNKVAHTVAKTFVELGMPTIRFNFRGVGQSEGEFDEGVGEQDDLFAVVNQMREFFPFESLWLAGFSFGSFVAFNAHKRVEAERLITVAPPVRMFKFDDSQQPTCPWLLVQGMADEVVSAQEILDWATKLSTPPDIETLDDASHFFHGRLNDLKRVIIEHVSKNEKQ